MRLWLCAGAANGFIAAAMGALAAHIMQDQPWHSARQWIEIGAEYQMAHALALLAVAVLLARATGAARRWLMAAGWTFLVGVVLFSGTLFAMGLGGLTALGPIVPVGGLAFLIGWAVLFYAGLRHFAAAAKEPAAPTPELNGDRDDRQD